MNPTADQPATPAAPPLQGTADIGAQRIARVYAEALYDTAAKAAQFDSVLEQLHSLIDDVFQAQPQLETLIAGSAVGRTAKEAIIRKAFQGRSNYIFLNFLLVLNRHERLGL